MDHLSTELAGKEGGAVDFMAMDIEKTIRSYAKIYRKALVEGKIKNVDDEITSYEKRLGEMYHSESFQKHSGYPTTNAVHVYAVKPARSCVGIQSLPKGAICEVEVIATI